MLGKLLSYEQDENGVSVSFEKGTGRISIINDRIIRIYSHFEGKERPSRAVEKLWDQKREFQIRMQGEELTIRTKKVLIRIGDDFKAGFFTRDGQTISEELKESSHEPKHLFEVVRKLYPNEHIYGLGDKAGFLDKKGYEYEMWNSDIPDTHTDFFKSLYKSIPFFISVRPHCCYGIFFDNSDKTFFDMGKENPDYYYFGADSGSLDYYFIAGDSIKDIVGGYTKLTGTTPLPQRWTLGYHQSRWSYGSEKEVMEIAEKMRDNHIPCDAIHLDIDYMDSYKVFTWDRKKFDPEKMIKTLADKGFKTVTIIDPGVKEEKGYDVYDEGVKNNYFAVDQDGEVYVNEVWPGRAVYPSFTNPVVRSWWSGKQKFLIDKGVRGVWDDMNEPASFKGEIPEDVMFSDEDNSSIEHANAHNVYGHCMAMAAYEGWKKYDGRRPFVITRACYAGTQKYAMVWTGDNQSVWAHLQMAIPQLCNLGLSGFSFAGTDVGGFGADTTKELLARWVEVGCLSPFFRNHSAAGTRRQEPWTFDKELLDIYRKYTELRYRLLPYIYDCFFEGEQTGYPVMRPLVFNFQQDHETYTIDNEFMVGEWLLAAPVTEHGAGMRMVYLPSGTSWYDFWTGESIKGGQYILKKAPLDTMPLYVKAGAVIPMYPLMQYTGEKRVDALTLAVYPGKGSYIHYQDDGESYGYREGRYNAYVFSQQNGKLQIKAPVMNYKEKYNGFYVKICRDGETALSAAEGSYLTNEDK